MVPLIGPRRLVELDDSLSALEIALTPEEVRWLKSADPSPPEPARPGPDRDGDLRNGVDTLAAGQARTANALEGWDFQAAGACAPCAARPLPMWGMLAAALRHERTRGLRRAAGSAGQEHLEDITMAYTATAEQPPTAR